MEVDKDVLRDYLESHTDVEPSDLHKLYRYTNIHCLYPRMCAGHYQGRLLKMFTAMVNPRRALEIGTYTGYSTLCIAEGLSRGATLDTIEVDFERREELTERFATSPYGDAIILHIGDALQVVKELTGVYDLVYVDANKRHYAQYLEAVYPLVRPGGFILADNTLWDMKVVTEPDSHDSQTQALIRFNDALTSDTRFEKIILPVRDGLTIIRKK